MIEQMEHRKENTFDNLPSPQPMTRDRKRILLLAGALGLVSAGLIAAAPELGFVSAVASVFAGGASAVTTLIAKR